MTKLFQGARAPRGRMGAGRLLAIMLVAAFLAPAALVIVPTTTTAILPPGPMPGYGDMDPNGVPHYFGPYPNYANSPVPKGAITAVTVEDFGENYTAPVVTIRDAWGTGAGATAIATVVDGVVTNITVTSGGHGYSAPEVIITDPTGTNASADATIVGNLTGGIRKFVDTLPGVGAANANNLGDYIPLAVADTTTFPGCDYYEIGLVDYTQKMHSDLPSTLLRGYVQLETAANYASSKHVALKNPDGSAVMRADGSQAIGVDNPCYLGPIILSQRDVPARITFHNLLRTGSGGDLFLPVDTTIMGAGMGPLDAMGRSGMKENYTENRATLHLHGGLTPWISDGTPHQWTTPADEMTQYPKGVSVQYVPDMWFVNGSVVANTTGVTASPVAGATNDPGAGSLTFYYTNQQSARLMFYHDHAYGITRLNVYAGEAAGYLLTDSVEQDLIDTGVLPNAGGVYTYGIPLVIQDKTFVDASTIAYQDPTWAWGATPGTPHTGDLWYPHVWMPSENPYAPGGDNPLGRWDYGPWIETPTANVTNGPVANPYYDNVNAPWEPPMMPGVPSVSAPMEAFMDTPTVNGVAYPYVTLNPQAYRFRILSAANDRFFDLQLYVADPTVTTADGRSGTEVAMVPANQGSGLPSGWPTDDRDGGVPDPAAMGPDIIQIGTEGGFLPSPVVIGDQPVNYSENGNVKDHSLYLGCAERADVVIDFSRYAGKTLILYNDAPAPVPMSDSRYDYYTGDPDQVDTGGAPTTQPGFGPNTRTIMQIRIANATPAAPYDVAALNAAFKGAPGHKGVFEQGQDPVLVPQSGYDSAYGRTFSTDAFVKLGATKFAFTTLTGDTDTIDIAKKTIQETQDDLAGPAYDTQYGRLITLLGIETGNGGYNLYGYASPPVDFTTDNMVPLSPVAGDGTRIWMIMQRGTDTHPFHFHLFNVQLIDRVGFDGTVFPPDPNELGWKETVRVAANEAAIVALRPYAPTLPFEVPNSVREIDPTKPDGAVLDPPSSGYYDLNKVPVTITNHVINYGWEYVMHCHILGHEENDMMHADPFIVAPRAPDGLAAAVNGTGVDLSWNDRSVAEMNYIVQRRDGSNPWTTVATVPSSWSTTGPSTGTVFRYRDAAVENGTIYTYQVLANNVIGDTASYAGSAGFPWYSVNSTPSDNVSAYVEFNGPGVAIISPAAGSYLRGIVAVSANVTDQFHSRVQYNVDGGQWINNTTTWDTTDFEDGAHDLTVRATSQSGLATTVTVPVVVDNSLPNITILSPLPDDRSHGIVHVNISVVIGQGLGNVTGGVAGVLKPLTAGPGGLYGFDIDPSDYSIVEGSLFISVHAVNLAGGTADAGQWIHVYNKAPGITITAGNKGKTTVTAKFAGSTNVSSASYRIDGGAWVPMKKADNTTYTAPWNTGAKGNGAHTVEVKVVDDLGNEGTQALSVKVDNPAAASSNSMLLVAVLIIVLVVAIIAGVAYMSMRKKGPTDPGGK
jgi:FtsP/CotA-like multicopper oxidase with cupredoxin domain